MTNETSQEKQGKTSISRKVRYDDNPFLNGFEVKTKLKNSTVERGETITGVTQSGKDATFVPTMMQVQEYDESSFIKVFPAAMGAIFGLSNAGVKMFSILLEQQRRHSVGKDVVFLPPRVIKTIVENQKNAIVQKGKELNWTVDEMAKEMKKYILSDSTAQRGLDNLIENKIIAPSSNGPHWYYTNPSVLFNGDRVRFIKEYRIKKNKDQQELFDREALNQKLLDGEEEF